MTFVAVGDGTKGQKDRSIGEGTAGGEGHAQATRARPREMSIAGAFSFVTDRVRSGRAGRQTAVTQDGSVDTVRGRSPWTGGAASPAEVLAYTRAGDWVPGEQEVWLERAGKGYGYLALLITVAVTFPLWVIQRPSRFALTTTVLGVLWLMWVVS